MISSIDNPFFRRLLAAATRADKKTGDLLLQGFHLLEAWHQRFGLPEKVVLPSGTEPSQELKDWLKAYQVEPVYLSPALFGKVCDLQQFQGPLALVRPKQRLVRSLSASQADAVYLERIQDPGNLGSMIRSAAAFGVKQLLLSPGCAWPWSAKVLRAGMSGHFWTELYEDVELGQINSQLSDWQVLLTVLDPTAKPIDQVNLREPNLWCFGNEGAGLSPALLALQNAQRVYVPQAPGVESLNVAATMAIALYEQQRQRAKAN